MSTSETTESEAAAEPDLDELRLFVTELIASVYHLRQRMRSLESALGYGSSYTNKTAKWNAMLEERFSLMLQEHDWEFHTSPEQLRRHKGELQYSAILHTADMLPIDVMLRIWDEHGKRLPPQTMENKIE